MTYYSSHYHSPFMPANTFNPACYTSNHNSTPFNSHRTGFQHKSERGMSGHNPQYNQKYFPKQLINIMPGLSNLPSSTIQQDKIIHPLSTHNTTSNSHLIHSPYHRGQIYHGNRQYIDQNQQLMNLRLENPFNKKYLLSQKNQELENYAMDTYYREYYQGDFSTGKRRYKNKGSKGYLMMNGEQSSEEMGEKMKRLAEKYGKQQQERGTNQYQHYQSNKGYYGGRGYRSSSDHEKDPSNPFQKRLIQHVDSQIDQKQFGSFGQGKTQANQQNLNRQNNHNNYSNKFSNNSYNELSSPRGQSIINGLTNISLQQNSPPHNQHSYRRQNNQYNNQKVQNNNFYYNGGTDSFRRRPVFIDSDDDSRKSGSFRIPDAIIQQINKQAASSVKIDIKKPTQTNSKIRMQSNPPYQNDERVKFSQNRSRNIQQGRQLPRSLKFRGKSYEKILIN